jgi:hypothetical protein
MNNHQNAVQLYEIQKSLEIYLNKKTDINFVSFSNQFTQWFNKEFYDVAIISEEEKKIMISVIKNQAFLIKNPKNGNQHPSSFPFSRVIQNGDQELISFSSLFVEGLIQAEDHQLNRLIEILIDTSTHFKITGVNLSVIQYIIHKHLFKYKNNEYEVHFFKDYESLIATDQFINLYDEVLNEVPEIKQEYNSKRISNFKKAIESKRDFGRIVHGFDLGKINAAYQLQSIFKKNEVDTNQYYSYGLNKLLTSILKPKQFTFTYENNKKAIHMTYIKEFENVNIEQLIKSKNYDALGIVLLYLPDDFKDKLFNYTIDHSDLKMIRTFLKGGAYYLTPISYSEDFMIPPKRDIQKTNTMLAMLDSQNQK